MSNLSGPPSSPGLGEQYFDTTLAKQGVWNGSAWIYSTSMTGFFDVTQYGVVLNSTGAAAANVTALNTLLGTTATAGSTIWFPPGTCYINASLTSLSKAYNFQGCYGSSNICMTTSVSTSWITCANASSPYMFSGLSFFQLTGTACTGGATIEFGSTLQPVVTDCQWNGGGQGTPGTMYNALDFTGATPGNDENGAVVEGCNFGWVTNCWVTFTNGNGSAVISNCLGNGSQVLSGNTAAGITITTTTGNNGGAILIDSCDIIKCTNNLLINPVSGTTVASVKAINSFFDQGAAQSILVNGAGTTTRCTFDECYIAVGSGSSSLQAVELVSSVVSTGIEFTSCFILNANGNTGSSTGGIFVTGAADLKITNCLIGGFNGSGGYGIAVTPLTAGTCVLTVTNNQIGAFGGMSGNNIGLILYAGSVTYGNITVQGNQFLGNTTNVSDSSTIPASPTQLVKRFEGNTGMATPVAITATTAGTAAAKIIASMPVPAGGLRAGSVFQFEGYMTTTAADTAAVTVYFGTTGTTTDTPIGTATSLASASTGDVYIRGTVTMRSATSAATVISTLSNASGAQVGNTTVAATAIANTSNSYLSVGINAATTATIQSMVIWPVIQ